jgi:acyl carrier protein
MNQDQISILEILAKHAQRAPGTLETSDVLGDLDIDSLKFLLVILEVEQQLGRHIFDIDNVGHIRTVADILDLVGTPHGA